MKTVGQLKKILDKYFKKWIRETKSVDGYANCISCGAVIKNGENMDAGHYIPSTHLATRFEPNNVWPQCRKCNRFMSGNLISYREKLVEKIGLEAVENLEKIRHDKVKYTRTELKELIEKYKNELKKRN